MLLLLPPLNEGAPSAEDTQGCHIKIVEGTRALKGMATSQSLPKLMPLEPDTALDTCKTTVNSSFLPTVCVSPWAGP